MKITDKMRLDFLLKSSSYFVHSTNPLKEHCEVSWSGGRSRYAIDAALRSEKRGRNK